jgi:HEPN domain-containing protein
VTQWSRGQADIEEMLGSGELQRVTGAGADGGLWLSRATITLKAAEEVADTDTNSAYTLAYDSARFACAALLAQQGLRGTTKGGHYAIQRAVIRQFGSTFEPFGLMRRRRNELEYPELPDETVERNEANDAIANAYTIIEAARQLLDHLGFF